MLLDKRVVEFVESLGLELNAEPQPHVPYPACYFVGHKIIWVNPDFKPTLENELEFIVLHEVGHALIDDVYGIKFTEKRDEEAANVVALSYCALLGIKPPDEIISLVERYANGRKKVESYGA